MELWHSWPKLSLHGKTVLLGWLEGFRNRFQKFPGVTSILVRSVLVDAQTATIEAMKVFLSYGSAADQVTALRLQALAAVNGLTVYVPPAHTRPGTANVLDPEVRRKLAQADVILGVVGVGFTEACKQELNVGFAQHKNPLVMCYPAFEPLLRTYFGANLVVINPADPTPAEASVVQHLKAVDAKQKEQKALVALGTLAIGLLIFALATHD
jgi:hypothetical protein